MDLELDLNLLKALRYSIPIRIFQLLFRGRIFNSITEKVAKFDTLTTNFWQKSQILASSTKKHCHILAIMFLENAGLLLFSPKISKIQMLY